MPDQTRESRSSNISSVRKGGEEGGGGAREGCVASLLQVVMVDLSPIAVQSRREKETWVLSALGAVWSGWSVWEWWERWCRPCGDEFVYES